MIYSFNSSFFKEGNRTFISIPFNVWETCKVKGMIPVKVIINDVSFQCKLMPKGKGVYYIPIVKSVLNKISSVDEVCVKFQIIEGLTRINFDSPYSKENPIRKIDRIEYVKQPDKGLCGQTCIAMLTGLPIDEIINVMHSNKCLASISKVIEALDYYGIAHSDKFIYTRGGEVKFPKCCIINVQGNKKSHLMVYYNGIYYDPTYGVMADYPYEKVISYLEITVE